MTKLQWIVAKLRERFGRKPAEAETAVTPAYLPLQVSVAKIQNGVALVFELSDREFILLLPKPHALKLMDTVLDTLGEEDEPRAS